MLSPSRMSPFALSMAALALTTASALAASGGGDSGNSGATGQSTGAAALTAVALTETAFDGVGADTLSVDLNARLFVSTDVGPLVPVRSTSLDSPLGQPVRTANGEKVGRVIDLLTDPSGRIRAAVIELGGFLGIGSRRIAVAWNAVRFMPGSPADGVIVDVTRDQLRNAPEYRSNGLAIVTQPTDQAY